MSAVSLDTIGNTITKAIVDASEKYFRLTGGTSIPSKGLWGIETTPEYWYTTHVALALGKRGCPVRLESGMKEIENCSCGPVKGRVEVDHRIGGRTDALILWKSDLTPRGCVEVKRCWAFTEQCQKDAARIRAALRRDRRGGGTLQFGIIAIAHDWQDKGGQKNTNTEAQQRFSNWMGKVQETVGDEFAVRKYVETGRYNAGDGMFFAVAFLITAI